MSLTDRIDRAGPKKLLSIDGGGLRGVLALAILKEVETVLAAGRPDFRLADYFDYIAGTSTGAIIASGLSIGMSVDEILKFYQESGAQMFVKANLLARLRYKFEDEPLARMLRQVFGADTRFGSDKVRTLLMMVMRNATTDSPWPLSNNPYAKYNDTARSDCNLNLPLWQLVRASTAAPTYFPPEVILLNEKQFVFVDGGVTMYNDPAFQMFLMATLDRYWAKAPDKRFKAGAKNMLIVSVGTGTAPNVNAGLNPGEMNILYNATTIPSALMFAAQNEQDVLCRVFGDCRFGAPVDRELDDLIPAAGPLGADQKLFTYLRYDADISRAGLDALGCKDVATETVQKLDSIQGIPQLLTVGGKVAGKVTAEHFAGFPI
jgi:patatin-like phospholipase/acyl hydrolase